MITKLTAFVIGAGANVPYRFSSGKQLLTKARSLENIRTFMGNAGQQIIQADADALGHALKTTMLPSIDLLLEHRQDLWPVGKRLIAALLYQEEGNAVPPESDDWMSLVFSRMVEDAKSVEEFGKNPVTFITFNYDRYLEYRIISALVTHFNIEPYKAWCALKNVHFLHVHGSLGNLPEQLPPTSALGSSVPFAAVDTLGIYTLGYALALAENTIKIVHDAQSTSSEFANVHKIFMSHDQILFIGFGFGKKNMERLAVQNIPRSAKVFCTALGMTSSEISSYIGGAFPNHPYSVLAPANIDAVTITQFLRDRVPILD